MGTTAVKVGFEVLYSTCRTLGREHLAYIGYPRLIRMSKQEEGGLTLSMELFLSPAFENLRESLKLF